MTFIPVADCMIDLDNDGRDEIVFWYDEQLSAWGRDLKDRWSIPAHDWPVFRVPGRAAGGSRALFLPSARILDGRNGHVQWTYNPPWPSNRYGGELLDPGGRGSMPRLINSRNGWVGTVCRYLLASTAKGAYAPATGTPSLWRTLLATTRAGRVSTSLDESRGTADCQNGLFHGRRAGAGERVRTAGNPPVGGGPAAL